MALWRAEEIAYALYLRIDFTDDYDLISDELRRVGFLRTAPAVSGLFRRYLRGVNVTEVMSRYSLASTKEQLLPDVQPVLNRVRDSEAEVEYLRWVELGVRRGWTERLRRG